MVLPHIVTLKKPPQSHVSLPIGEKDLPWDRDYFATECFVDESLKDSKASFGVYFAKNHPWNLSSHTASKQELQESTCQGIIYALKKIPSDLDIWMYIDCKVAIDVLDQLPLPPRVQHKTSGVAFFNQIHHLLKKHKGKVCFKQVYSHLQVDANTPLDRAQKVEEHLKAMTALYRAEHTVRLTEGNTQADLLSEIGLSLPEVRCLPTTKHNPRYIINSSSRNAPAPILDTFRPTLKDKSRLALQQKTMDNKSIQDPWVGNKEVDMESWKLLKSVDPADEETKLHFNRLLHNTLPTKAKIFPHIERESLKHSHLGAPTRFWRDCYPYITDNLCTFCKAAPETMDHLHACTSPTVTNARLNLVRKLKGETDKLPTWMVFSSTAMDTPTNKLPIHFASRGLIPKISGLNGIGAVQALILKASLRIWHMRCRRLFSSGQQAT